MCFIEVAYFLMNTNLADNTGKLIFEGALGNHYHTNRWNIGLCHYSYVSASFKFCCKPRFYFKQLYKKK